MDTALTINKKTQALSVKPQKKEDLPQILRFIDFFASDAGRKLQMWEAHSAGFFEEKDGKRIYKDKDMEDYMVDNVQNGMDTYYNFCGEGWPTYPTFRTNKYNPKFTYNIKRDPGNANAFFSMGLFESQELKMTIAPNSWESESYGIKGVQDFWGKRAAFEKAIRKVFVSSNRDEFEAAYQNMVELATRNGLNDATLAEINAAYKDINADSMAELLQ